MDNMDDTIWGWISLMFNNLCFLGQWHRYWICLLLSLSKLAIYSLRCYPISTKKSTHSKVDAPERVKLGSYEPASPVCRQERHFYLRFLFLLSKRKLSNATSRLHDVTTKVSIPKNIEIISNAVICATSLPRQRSQSTIVST